MSYYLCVFMQFLFSVNEYAFIPMMLFMVKDCW